MDPCRLEDRSYLVRKVSSTGPSSTLHTLAWVEAYHLSFTRGADEAFAGMPAADQRLFAEKVFLVLQNRPHHGDGLYEVIPSRSTPGLYHLTFGGSIVSYSIDPSSRTVRVTDFSY